MRLLHHHLDVVPGELNELLAVVQQLFVHELDQKRTKLQQLHAKPLGILSVAAEAFLDQLGHLLGRNTKNKNKNENKSGTKRKTQRLTKKQKQKVIVSNRRQANQLNN